MINKALCSQVPGKDQHSIQCLYQQTFVFFTAFKVKNKKIRINSQCISEITIKVVCYILCFFVMFQLAD